MQLFTPFIISFLTLILTPIAAVASEGATGNTIDLTSHWVGYASIAIFVFAYILVMLEENIHLPKSTPVVLAAGLVWILIGHMYVSNDLGAVSEAAIRHNLLEFSELFLFLLVAMTYVNAMMERRLFDALRCWLVSKGFGFRQLFWITGILSFLISPIADNLTTALLMCAVVMAVGAEKPKFVGLACINIVVAANAGGAFSPFGDITTLMVWQKGILSFQEFFVLFIPAVVNFVVPALFMNFAIPNVAPAPVTEVIETKPGAKRVVVLFMVTIATAVSFHNVLHLPPVFGMMAGLAYLKIFSYYLQKTSSTEAGASRRQREKAFDFFDKVAKAEWDTLLFFYGVVLCVGGLGFIGYLAIVSEAMYVNLGPTIANVLVGVLSAIVDNIPVMFAVLTMQPDMSHGQWLLVTLTAGVGGSMLSIGSAAGVALMGQARGYYTFVLHLKWAPVIALGYGASILVHFLVNGALF